MTPETEEALADAIKSARGPVSVSGGGTRSLGVHGEALSSKGMSGISLYEPGALTLVAQAGTPVSDIAAALATENQRLAFEPMDHRVLLGATGEPTLGGMIAANVSGPRRIQVGAARDFALGVRFVDGSGNIIKNGGRVMKNVTGYDLVKLMCGSYGTLGVLTEVALKVLPVPETQGTLLLHGLSDGQAVAVMARALASPFEVSGAAHGVQTSDAASATALRVEGFEASVEYRLGRLTTLLADTGAQITVADAVESGSLWAGVRDVQQMADSPGDIWRVSCKPSQGPDLAARSGAEGWYFDWAGGLIWVRMAPGLDLRARLGAYDGHATLVRAGASSELPRFEPEVPGVAKLTAGLRARFDPRGILNTGLMGHTLEGVA